MARGPSRTTPRQQVMRYYLQASLAEIEDLQPVLREIYQHRKGMVQRSVAARVAKAEPTATGAPKVGKKKGKKKAASEGVVFGDKQVVSEAVSA